MFRRQKLEPTGVHLKKYEQNGLFMLQQLAFRSLYLQPKIIKVWIKPQICTLCIYENKMRDKPRGS